MAVYLRKEEGDFISILKSIENMVSIMCESGKRMSGDNKIGSQKNIKPALDFIDESIKNVRFQASLLRDTAGVEFLKSEFDKCVEQLGGTLLYLVNTQNDLIKSSLNGIVVGANNKT